MSTYWIINHFDIVEDILPGSFTIFVCFPLSTFSLSVLTELQNRGVEQILIACVDGLSGFPDAIHTTFPATKIKLCIIRMVRNSLKYVPWKDYKEITADLKKIYQSATEQEACRELDHFAEKWDEKYPGISKSWRNNWPNLITFFDYPPDIKMAIYTTNAIESLNSVIRKSIKTRTLFSNDNLALKVVYLAIQSASKKWDYAYKELETGHESVYDRV